MLKNPFIVFAIFLQIASFSLIRGSANGDSLTLAQIVTEIVPISLAVGQKMPAIPVYSVVGRQPLITSISSETVIFKADCTCDSIIIEKWIHSASQRQEKVTVVIMAPAEELSQIAKKNGLSGRILSTRPSDMQMLGHPSQLPIGLRVSPEGIILEVGDL